MSRRYWQWQRPFAWEPARTALLVIDMQCGFIEEGAPLEVPMARAQVPVVARLLQGFRSRGLPVLYTRFVIRDDLFIPFYRTMAAQRGLELDQPGRAFAAAGRDASIPDAIAPLADEPVVDKVAYDGFADTDLDGRLRCLGVDTIVLAGTVVNWCVDSTLRAAFHRRFNAIVVADAVSGFDHAGATGEQWVRQELDFFAEALAVVMSSDELLAALSDESLRRAGVMGREPDRAA